MYYKNLQFEDLPNEIWEDVPNLQGKYQVSNLGRVKTLINKREDKRGRSYSIKPKIMKQSFTSTGYLMVNLNHNFYKVHRLVGMAFLQKDASRPFINHKDGNPTNNVVENLEWCTQRENVNHAIQTGLTIRKKDLLNHDEVVFLYKTLNAKQIAEKLNTTNAVIYNILKSKKIKTKYKSKYNIDLEILKKEIKQGKSNKELAIKYNCSSNLIARRKYQMNKGEI